MVKSSSLLAVAIVLLSSIDAIGQGQLPPDNLGRPSVSLMQREAEYYPIIDLYSPEHLAIEAGSFVEMPNKRLAIGTRRGDIFFADGVLQETPDVEYTKYASGLHEVFGLAHRDGDLFATQQCEVTRIKDTNDDGRADRFETLSDAWGFGGEHEFTYGSQFDREGYLWTVHCLTGSYTSEHPFRGWCFRHTPDGKSIPTCSGLRSPGGIGMNASGDMFYTENQGPWNGACSLKHLKPGGFMGHPVSFPWYADAPNMGPTPEKPQGGRDERQHIQADRVKQLVPPAIVLPYKKMGQSASAISLDTSAGKFGPFANQVFVADYTLSIVMRVDMENIDGVYQGSCFPFRNGFSTGLIGAVITEDGYYVTGGCSRGWPTRGSEPFGLQRMHWSGKVPFEVHSIRIQPDGFVLKFTQPIDKSTATDAIKIQSYTHYYQQGYGSPEVDQADVAITSAKLSDDALSLTIQCEGVRRGYVHEFSFAGVKSVNGETLLHDVGYYTVNRIPK